MQTFILQDEELAGFTDELTCRELDTARDELGNMELDAMREELGLNELDNTFKELGKTKLDTPRDELASSQERGGQGMPQGANTPSPQSVNFLQSLSLLPQGITGPQGHFM